MAAAMKALRGEINVFNVFPAKGLSALGYSRHRANWSLCRNQDKGRKKRGFNAAAHRLGYESFSGDYDGEVNLVILFTHFLYLMG